VQLPGRGTFNAQLSVISVNDAEDSRCLQCQTFNILTALVPPPAPLHASLQRERLTSRARAQTRSGICNPQTVPVAGDPACLAVLRRWCLSSVGRLSAAAAPLPPVWISRGCKGNAALWYFTPHLNQWSLYLTMPGNYLGTSLDHVNSCRTRGEGSGGRAGLRARCRERGDGYVKKRRSSGTKTTQTKMHFFVPALFSASVLSHESD